jgi:hypothetical protein
MPDELLARSKMAEIEDRIGLRPIEELLAERRELVERHADVQAVYGAFGTWDHQRKVELSRIKMLLRAQAVKDGIKVTEGGLEDAAHAHTDYVAFVTEATVERAEWVRVESQIDAIDATIRRGQSIAHYLAAESRLTP